MSSKNIYFLFLVFFFIACNAQSSNDRNYHGKKTSDSTVLGFDSSFLDQSGKSSLEMFVEHFADSLNNLRKTGLFPVFLEDPQFDYKNSIGAPSHHPFPLRQMIISKVKDCQSLHMMIESKNEKYLRKPIKESGIDVEYSNLSFHELAANRYKEMNCSIMY